MKKYVSLFLALIMIFTLASCGGDGGGKAPSESPPPAESGNAPSSEVGADENRYYGIGEAAEANGLSITIDKVEAAEPNTMLEKAKDEIGRASCRERV